MKCAADPEMRAVERGGGDLSESVDPLASSSSSSACSNERNDMGSNIDNPSRRTTKRGRSTAAAPPPPLSVAAPVTQRAGLIKRRSSVVPRSRALARSLALRVLHARRSLSAQCVLDGDYNTLDKIESNNRLGRIRRSLRTEFPLEKALRVALVRPSAHSPSSSSRARSDLPHLTVVAAALALSWNQVPLRSAPPHARAAPRRFL